MAFYKIFPASLSYKGAEPLVYSAAAKLKAGQLVSVPLRNETCAGVVIGSSKKPAFRAKIISHLSELPPLPPHLISLADWMMNYYACGSGPVIRQLIRENYLKNTKNPETLTPQKCPQGTLPPLTREQKSALSKIAGSGTYVLHGETGSGKTRLYVELTEKSLTNGKSAIILTPEIGLTAQLSREFKTSFGDRVIITHSQLTPTERRRIWQQLLTAVQPLVVIGPRSTLFSPLKDIGLIVIDESHDGSYKQNDAPHYSAITTAAKLAELNRCPLILGSATPSINDYFMAQSRGRPILRLNKLAIKTTQDRVKLAVIDIKERSQFKRSQLLSDELIKYCEEALARKEQVLLFLNRRGTARVTICTSCGWSAVCPHCNLPLTYHGDTHLLRCHSCNYHQLPVSQCPNCGSNEINFKGSGTKAIEAEAKKLFPKAVVRRFDNDNPKRDRLEQAYDQLKGGKIDIIIGTQAIAKGLDLPNLTVVGIVTADTGLYLPDFSADERTYQLIRQVIGRVGRGHRPGTALIQTYNPDNPIIKAAIYGDYESFYKHELAARQKFNFPPARHLLKLTVGRTNASSAEATCKKIKLRLEQSKLRVVIDGPSPCFHETRNGKHYWQLVLRANQRSELLTVLSSMPAEIASELDPISLL